MVHLDFFVGNDCFQYHLDSALQTVITHQDDSLMTVCYPSQA